MTRFAAAHALRIAAIAFVAIGLSAATGLTLQEADAKPKPEESGEFYCLIHNADPTDPDGRPEFNYEDHSCCYWESQGNGESMHVCLECDENWRNCKEVFASGKPTLSTAPAIDRTAPRGTTGIGTKLPATTLKPQHKLQGTTN